MSSTRRPSRRTWLAAVAVFALAVVGAALYTQHAWDMLPCPWCVLQRLIFLAIAAAALLGMLWPLAGAASVLALGACGVAAALWQHFVAVSSESCDLTLADRIVAATGLDGRFQGSLTGEMIDHGFIRPAGVGYQLWRRIEWLAARLPQAVLVSSLRAAPLLQEQFGVPPARIHPLPDCADLAHFDPARFSAADKAAVRAQFGIPAGRPVVAYLGLLADYQGTPHLLHAAAQLKAAGEEVHFLVMGFPNEDQYLAMAVALGVEDRVTFTGRVDYEKHAPLYLSVGDIAVSPKLSATEGSGKVLNYMALGQPVVAFDTRVHREYLADLGVYVPRGDVAGLAEAIRALLHDPGRGWALGQQLRQRAIQLYSWTAAAQKIEAVYASLLAARGARPLAGNLREDLE